MKKIKGFTVIEVLICLVIIAIILSSFLLSLKSGIISLNKASDTTKAYALSQEEAEVMESNFKLAKNEVNIDDIKELLSPDKYAAAEIKLKDKLSDNQFDTFKDIRGSSKAVVVDLFNRKVEGISRPFDIIPEKLKGGEAGRLALFLSFADIPKTPVPALKSAPEIELRVVNSKGETEKIANSEEIWKKDSSVDFVVDKDGKETGKTVFKKASKDFEIADKMNIYFVGIDAKTEKSNLPEGGNIADTAFSKYQWWIAEVDKDGRISGQRKIRVANPANTEEMMFDLKHLHKSASKGSPYRFDMSTIPSIEPVGRKDRGHPLLKYSDEFANGADFLRPSDMNGTKRGYIEKSSYPEHIFDFTNDTLSDAIKNADILIAKEGSDVKAFNSKEDDARLWYDYFSLTLPSDLDESLEGKLQRKAIGFEQIPVSKYGTEGEGRTRWFYLGEVIKEEP